MTDVLFVQGAGPGVHADWDIHLVESLRRELGPLYDVRYPQMPDEVDPRMEAWRPVLQRELAELLPGGIAVGHSAGGTMLLHLLADRAPANGLGAVVLIAAPFLGPGGWVSEEIAPRADLGERLRAVAPVLLFHGEDDEVVPVAHVELYAATIPHARVRRLPGRDHQLNDDLSEVARDIRELTSRAVG